MKYVQYDQLTGFIYAVVVQDEVPNYTPQLTLPEDTVTNKMMVDLNTSTLVIDPHADDDPSIKDE